MALVKCTECGREVSDQAAACPNCGAPVRSAAVPGTGSGVQEPRFPSVSGRRILRLLGVAILLILAVLLVLPLLRRAGVVPTARFAVDNVGGNESCSVLGDYCLRVQCAVANTGNGQGSIQVTAEIVPDEGPAVSHRSTRVLNPGQREVISMDFPEAEMGKHYSYSCSGQP